MAIINGKKLSIYNSNGDMVGISLAEIATVLGEPITVSKGIKGDELDYLCQSKKIRKWNIFKPINKSKIGKLEEADFKGESIDISNGVIYGLRAGINTKDFTQMHNADWEYVGRPTQYNRVGDFDGYDHTIEAPTLSGAGLEDGMRIKHDAMPSVELVWSSKAGAIDLAEVFTAYTNDTPDYGDMYLCALVGNYARALINIDAGNGVYPIEYNSTQCKRYAIPAVSSIITTDTTVPVTLFFASKTAIEWSVNGKTIKNDWVDISGLKFDTLLISVPNQVNKSVDFVGTLMQYIKGFTLSIDGLGGLQLNIEKGNDWSNAYAYQARWGITDTAGNNYPNNTTTSIPIENDFIPMIIYQDLLRSSGIVQGNQSYTITATIYYQTSEGGTWVSSGYRDSVNVAY